MTQTTEIVMPDKQGFHLRVVADFVNRMRQFDSVVRVRKGKIVADGKSTLDLLLLAAAWRSKLFIEVEGDDAIQTMEGVKDFFQIEKVYQYKSAPDHRERK